MRRMQDEKNSAQLLTHIHCAAGVRDRIHNTVKTNQAVAPTGCGAHSGGEALHCIRGQSSKLPAQSFFFWKFWARLSVRQHQLLQPRHLLAVPSAVLVVRIRFPKPMSRTVKAGTSFSFLGHTGQNFWRASMKKVAPRGRAGTARGLSAAVKC